MTEPRLLKCHQAAATCCIAYRDRPGVVATGGEDGCVYWYDMRCKDMIESLYLKEPISSMCLKPGNEDIIYVSTGTEIRGYDVHLVSSCEWLVSHNINQDEINQISCNSRSSFLAAADDAGDVRIIDINQDRLYKTLRAGHSSICSSVQFLPWRPWEVITGGLDSKLLMWDFSKGRPIKALDFGLSTTATGGSAGQCLNPAFIHAIAVPEADMVDRVGKVCVAARGDGVVDVIDIESEFTAVKPKSFSKPGRGTRSGAKISVGTEPSDSNGGKRFRLDYTVGGHTAAASCVAFSMFGEKGKYIVSGGNDKSVKIWDWSKYSDAGEISSNSDLVKLNIGLSRKVNWLCTTPTDTENLIVCDTSKVVKVYTAA